MPGLDMPVPDPEELEKLRREIPDHALDKHTMRGRKMGRGSKHFFEEGSKLVNKTVDDPFEERAKNAFTQLDGDK
jgi:hypothetical protein